MIVPILGSLGVLLSWVFIPPGSIGGPAESLALTMLCVMWMVRSRSNLPSFMVALFSGHAIYSIALCFYVFPDRFNFPLGEAVSTESLAVGLRLLWLIPIALWHMRDYVVIPRLSTVEQSPAFWVLILTLIYIALFEIDRTGAAGEYRVRITAMYEYSYLLVALAAFALGKSRLRGFALLAVCAFIIIQDAVYGGRVTSVQVSFVLMFTVLRPWLNALRVTGLAILGILSGAFIATVRGSESTSAGFFDVAQSVLSDGLLTSATAQYAYYASLTHISAAPLASFEEKSATLRDFFSQILFGGGDSLTGYVAEHYFVNVGGGIFTSHFYFWGGPLSVVLASVVLAFLMKYLGSWSTWSVAPALLTVLFASVPRWLLYSPTSAVRPLLIFLVLSGILLIVGRGGPTRRSDRGSRKEVEGTSTSSSGPAAV